MDQNNQTQPSERDLYLRRALVAIERFKAAVQTRRQQDAQILAAVVRGLSEPRGMMGSDVQRFSAQYCQRRNRCAVISIDHYLDQYTRDQKLPLDNARPPKTSYTLFVSG